MAPNSLSKNRRSNIPYDLDDDSSSLIVISDVLATPLPKNCLGGDDIGLVLEGLPDEEDLTTCPGAAIVDCNSLASQAESSLNSSMNSSFCIWDKLNTQDSLRQDEETVDALTAVAADGRPMFYQFQDEHEKSISHSNRSRTCFDGDSKHSTRSMFDHSNRTSRVRTIEMDDDIVTTAKKCVQFAENIDGSVKSTMHTYPKATDPKLWWSSEEWVEIKKKIRKAVNYHKINSNPKYNESIRGLMYSYRKSATKESTAQHMSQLLHYWDARGLESYIVGHSKALTDAHLDAVLKVQHEMQLQGLAESDKGMEEIRKAGKKSSRPARQLALKLAESDKYHALRATLSSWK